jgi:hypothetical protein
LKEWSLRRGGGRGGKRNIFLHWVFERCIEIEEEKEIYRILTL